LDDKVGIFVALQALLDIPNIKVVLFRNEEIGRIGSRFSINNCSDFYKDCNFILQCDRKGNYDFLTKSAGVKMTSTEFENAVAPLLKKYDFISSEAGIATDVDVLVENGVGVCAANISSGYYSPHTDKETVSVYNIGRAYSLVYDICDTFKNKKFLYKYVKPVHKHFSYSSRSSYSTYNTGNYEDTDKTSKLKGIAPYLEYSGTPSEVFQAISFLSTEECGKLSEHSLGILTFNIEKHASQAMELLKKSKDSTIKASLVRKGILIDSI